MTVITIKKSSVEGKIPSAGDLQIAELAVNLKDRKLYTKDADGNVVALGGEAQVPGGDTPPVVDNKPGDLFWDTATEQLLYWDGTQWLPIAGDEAIGITDLTDVTVAGVTDGQVLAYDSGSGEWVNVSPASLSVDVDLGYDAATNTVTNSAGDDAVLTVVDAVNAGLMEPADKAKLDALPAEGPVYVGTNEPGTPSNGDIWVDLNECPPELKIWSNCSGTGQWEEIEGSPPLVVTQPVLSGTPQQGETLTCSEAVVVGGKPPVTSTYKFTDASDVELQNTAARTYVLSAGDLGKIIKCAVVATDSRGTVETSLDSNALGPVTPPSAVNTPTLITPADAATDVSASSIVMSCSAFSGTSVTYGQTVWQVSTASDFSSTVLDETNTDQTSFTAGFNPPLGYEATYYARCAHKSSTGIQSAWSNVNEFETQANPVDPNIPSADMSGLRFDSARNTHLSRSSGSSNSWTFSCWVKSTESSGNGYVLSKGDNKGINITADGKVNYWNGSVQMLLGTVVSNTWSHIVVTYKDTTLTGYVNGVQTGSGANNASAFSKHVIGTNTDGNYLDGYLSETYFAEEALLPTAFGKTFPDGRWGPLTSDEIKDNINNYPKLPEGANTSQVWSSGVSNTESVLSGDGTNIFDGNDATFFAVSGDITVTKTFGTITSVAVTDTGNSEARNVLVNGSVIGTIPATTSGDLRTTTLSFTAVNAASITIENGSNNAVNAIYTNNRLLVDDGVWDASQNWSDSLTSSNGYYSNRDADKAFNGVVENANGAATIDGATLTFDPKTTIPSNSVIEVMCGSSSYSWDITVDGSTGQVIPNQLAFSTITYNNGTVFPKLEIKSQSSGSSADLIAIKLNGSILVDSGPTWNTSQVWSDGATGNFVRLPSYLFDGNTGPNSTTLGFTGAGATITFNPPVPFSTLQINGFLNNDLATNLTAKVNGIDVTDQILQRAGANSGPDNGHPNPITGVGNELSSFFCSTGSVNVSSFSAIIVDGSILVDKASFGSNGFYLPFDPTNTGANYSQGYFDLFYGSQFADVAFNGSLTDYTQVAETTAGGGYNFPSGLTGNLVVYVATKETTGGDTVVTLSDSTNQTSNQGYTLGAEALDFGSVSGITSIALTDGGLLWGVSLDGVLLVDHNSIGVDASGNENNFHDQNFGVGNTSQVWSKNLVAPSGMLNSAFTLEGAFDGSWSSNSAATDGPLEFTQALTVTQNLGIVSEREVKVTVYDANGDAEFISPMGGGSATLFTISSAELTLAGISQNITKIVVQNNDNSNNAAPSYLYAIIIDGVTLIEPSYLDTVTDTPLMNYAVLGDAGPGVITSNGNLSAIAPSWAWAKGTFSVNTGKYYWETIKTAGGADNLAAGAALTSFTDLDYNLAPGAAAMSEVFVYTGYQGKKHGQGATDAYGDTFHEIGDVIGTALDLDAGTITFYKNGVSQGEAFNGITGDIVPVWGGNNGSVGQASLNFGQQPFSASNVTYDQATGIATVGGVNYNTLFQTWDEWATTGLFFFNENTGRTITSFELNRKYGLTAAAPDAGIYNLTFQPRAQVLEYLKQKTAYLPLEDLFPQLEATEAKLANTEESLTATQTELVQVRAERDEAKDKLEDQISKLAARIALLETPKKGTKK